MRGRDLANQIDERAGDPNRLPTDAEASFTDLESSAGKLCERIDLDRFLHRHHGLISDLVCFYGAGSSPPTGAEPQCDVASERLSDRRRPASGTG